MSRRTAPIIDSVDQPIIMSTITLSNSLFNGGQFVPITSIIDNISTNGISNGIFIKNVSEQSIDVIVKIIILDLIFEEIIVIKDEEIFLQCKDLSSLYIKPSNTSLPSTVSILAY